MGELTRSRVKDRIESLGTTAFEAARVAGFQRNYFHDLLIGKKDTIRESRLEAAAQALKCDPEYLTGIQDMPRRSKGVGKTESKTISNNGGQQRMHLAGYIEADAWRRRDYRPDAPTVSAEPDPRFPADQQEVYLVRGDHAAALGITDASLLCTVTVEALEQDGRKLHDGDVVVVAQSVAKDMVELSARIYQETADGVRLGATPGRDDASSIPLSDDIQIRGLVLRAVRIFGLPA